MAIREKDEQEEGTEKPAEGVSGRNKKKIIIFATAGVLLLVLGIGLPLMLMGGSDGDEAAHEQEVIPEVVYKRAKLDTFIVNLSDPKRFLKTTLLLEYDPNLLPTEGGAGGGSGHGGGGSGGHGAPADPTALPAEMKEKEALVRDAVIQVLSSKRAEDLLTNQGKSSLKEELVEAINTALDFPEPSVVAVYFTEFIIQ